MNKNKKNLLATIFCCIFSSGVAEEVKDDLPGLALDEVQVVGTKNNLVNPYSSALLPESGNIIPAVTASSPGDTAHSTSYELNNMAGISILGGSQTVSQNISIGGQARDNIIVGIDGLNNYFSNFGGNDTRLLPSTYLFKQVTATQAGSDITYGSGNIGGAVNFTTIDPEDLLHGDKLSTVATLGGNSATNGSNANAAIAARTGSVTYLLDVVGTNDNNMQLGNGTIQPYSANQNIQALAKLDIDISKSQNLKLSLLTMQNQGQYPVKIVNDVNGTNPPANFNFTQNQSMLEYNYTPDNPYINLKAKLAYKTSGYAVSPISGYTGGYTAAQDIRFDTSSIDVQNTTIVAQQKLLYGLEYNNISGSDGFSSNTSLSFPTANQQIQGIFLQDSWDITKKINITAGTRYNSYQSQGGSDSNSGGLFTNQLGINYKFLPDWLAYAAYTEGFQAPTLSNLYLSGYYEYNTGAGYIYQANPNLLPEIAHNKTIGIKYDTLFTKQQHFTISANTFLNDVSNYVLWTYAGQNGSTNITQMSNIGQAQLYGYALSLSYSTPWVKFDTNFTSTYGYTQNSYITGSNNIIPAGSALPIPQAKGFVGLDFPIKSIDSSIQTYVNYTLTQTQTPATVYGTLPSAPGYTLFGLAYDWEPRQNLKGVHALFGIDNILNTNYQTYNGYSMFPALGRNIYAQIGYKY